MQVIVSQKDMQPGIFMTRLLSKLYLSNLRVIFGAQQANACTMFTDLDIVL